MNLPSAKAEGFLSRDLHRDLTICAFGPNSAGAVLRPYPPHKGYNADDRNLYYAAALIRSNVLYVHQVLFSHSGTFA